MGYRATGRSVQGVIINEAEEVRFLTSQPKSVSTINIR